MEQMLSLRDCHQQHGECHRHDANRLAIRVVESTDIDGGLSLSSMLFFFPLFSCGAGGSTSFVNPHGYVHEVLTVSQVLNTDVHGMPQRQDSWFQVDGETARSRSQSFFFFWFVSLSLSPSSFVVKIVATQCGLLRSMQTRFWYSFLLLSPLAFPETSRELAWWLVTGV